jgi:hypothetical protein
MLTTSLTENSVTAMSDVTTTTNFADRPSSVSGGASTTANTTSSTASVIVVTPKALPDVDDQSMTQVFNYIDSYRSDLSYSFLYDSFFIIGGLGYVVMATWDCLKGDSSHWVYRTLELAAPMVYLFNSIVDVIWAIGVQQRYKVKRRMEDTWRDWRVLLDDEQSEDVHEPPPTLGPPGSSTNNNNNNNNFQWITRLRKHAAHRRTLWAAFTFGVAAVMAVASVCAGYFVSTHPTSALALQNSFGAVSVHAYLLSAIIAVSGKRTRPWLGRPSLRNPETLEDLGDLLFLIGSSVDVVLCDMSFDDDKPGWPLFSSILWFLDACLYLRSDFIMADRMIIPEQERSSALV